MNRPFKQMPHSRGTQFPQLRAARAELHPPRSNVVTPSCDPEMILEILSFNAALKYCDPVTH
ncbi:MAG: hypothetical protein KTU85_12685 [Acidimicrobiia bacterium]|nr:hypothetical protein [Acidimicrobiia bacterium]